MWRVAAATIIAIVLWLAWCLQFKIAYWRGVAWNIERAGQWGDTFGALNALFAAFAFIGLVVTLRLQSKDQSRQKFDQTFYELLRLLRDERDSLRFRYSAGYAKANGLEIRRRYISRDALTSAINEARFWLRAGGRSGDLTKDQIVSIYDARIHSRFANSFGPYFRLLYNILDLIYEEKTLADREKVKYANIVRAQLSSHEVGLAALNGLAPYSKDFYDLVCMFRLLKYLESGNLKSVLHRFYPDACFEGRASESDYKLVRPVRILPDHREIAPDDGQIDE